ncbi:MAG: O-antigen ligase domain-containing protein [Bacteroidales bacterium]|nr:O-antigen ligase domain-containing protein [Bacteroidales bacterium]
MRPETNIPKNNPSEQASSQYSLMFAYTFIFLIFSFYFYELIGFDPLDEIFEVLLVLIAAVYLYEGRFLMPKKDLIIFSFVAVFYIIYSFLIHSNSVKAILVDSTVQLKPYIAFFVFYYLGVRFSLKDKKLLRFLLISLMGVSILVVLWGLITGNLVTAMKFVYFHPTRYATALVLIALFFLYTTEYTKKNALSFIIILSLALIAGKAKTFGFFAAALCIMAFYHYKVKFKFDFKTLLLITAFISVIIFVSWKKFAFYFVSFSVDDEESLARPFLYLTSFYIFLDYFPFGSGLASFATAASGSTYSDIYYQYDLNTIWGLSPDFPAFVADTYYPSLAQFGVFGLLLFIFFWIRIFKEALFYFKRTDDVKCFMIIILLTVFLAIEFIADAAFTNNRGFTTMILIALCLNEMKYSYENLHSEANIEIPVEKKKIEFKN